MLKKYTPILLFLLGLMISAILGYAAWDSGFIQNGSDKSTEEQQIASDDNDSQEDGAEQSSSDENAEADKAAQEAADLAAKEAADKAAQEAADLAAKEAAEKAAQEATDLAAKEAADKAAQEVADLAAKEAADLAAKEAADKAAQEAADLAVQEAAQKEAQKVAVEAAIQRDRIQNAMGFDILRIEPTGETVVAGMALAGSKVELVDALDQNRVLTETTSSAAGEFALVLDKPLSEGKHEIYIQSWDKDNNKFASNELALVEIFAASLNKTPVVILSKSGAPTRMLQGEEAQEETQVAQENTDEESEESNTEAETDQAEAKPEPVTAVYIKAADVEGGKLIIAGSGPADGVLNVYIDDQLLGQTKIAPNNSFIFEKSFDLEAGRHSIRADRIDAATNKVLGRAEVSLVHEPEVAAVEETSTEQAATEETATQEASTEETATQEATTEETGAQETTTEQATTEDANSSEEATQDEASTEDTNTQEAKEEIRTGSTVIIRRGDSLWRVSRKNYGQGIKFTIIFDANKDQIKDPDLIYPGQVFDIPELK